ncbi:hypothetical protein M0Q97_06570 [Candidatus Dojkabacteria bacterium]|jgi:hypothetical protein|nr:hypothetical protein [Candidatus Dojkabacteria bacterium]
MIYLKTFERLNQKYQAISKEKFEEILKDKCKNFSLDNDQLFRGDQEIFNYGYHNPIERNTAGITFVDFFREKEKDTEKYPVLRKNSLIGVGGASDNTLKQVAFNLSYDEDEPTEVYRVIPFDNSKIVFCPTVDLLIIKYLNNTIEINDDDFIMVEYNKNFKVPQDKLSEITQRLLGNKYKVKKGFEFFMSSPALLVNIKENFIF